jgi:hypothetical protein
MFAYVGGYTTRDRDGRGDGIHVYAVGADAVWTHVQHVVGKIIRRCSRSGRMVASCKWCTVG